MKYALLIIPIFILSGCTRHTEGTYRTMTHVPNPLVETIKAFKGTQGGPVRYSSQTDANMGSWR